ncbi:NADP-dependent oxidoreductase [Rothia sp. AR01]|uniref:NADP-dependent oxidoreductase n=1 Tax=Rothia santali TaxID=2949643 RepID=A0A9X2KHN4_9MICC|nr:NADP-dependent oxidoreductase [Rothia santali]MCP3425363.1 NADP-dependent oxidoreductase [Rothia santali]
MKAMTYERFGDSSELSLTEQPLPKVGPGEVLVKVHAAGINPVDWKAMSGGLDPMIETQFPAIPGWDVAGTVAAKGIDSPGFEEGDEVIAYARKDWIHGGTFAEYVSVPLRALARKPHNLTWEQAAGLPLAGLTAYQVLTRSDLEEGSTVLIHGASGGVGSMGVQIAVAAGARVIGTASAKNHDYLRQLGAEPVEYGEGLVDRVRELAPDGVDIVADFVGGVLDVTLEVLAEGGTHASIADPEVEKQGGAWMWVVPDAEDLAELGELVERGRLTVRVDSVFPLDRLPQAFEKSQEGRTVGKIVLQVSGD